ncbi:hypothetical protein [Sphingobacterium sp. ML3W]|uniref:hypothetical protein n=1 Tax=Sphingobacterium sp. ML3W TaxID=1538644 RepID=UPI00068E7B97|nr:hypothetical protein [Sphingobacterium sp. ML3W]
MDRIFSVDFKKLIINLLPLFFRRKGIFALIETLSSAMRTIYLMFLSKRDDHNKDLAITPQVFSLRKVLNDYFDAGDRSIRIEDSNLHERSYIFTDGEQRPLFLGERAIYTADELRFGTGFVVIVPESLNNVAETARLKAMINKYKLAGTKYTIRYE